MEQKRMKPLIGWGWKSGMNCGQAGKHGRLVGNVDWLLRGRGIGEKSNPAGTKTCWPIFEFFGKG
jgi:hypothetical protein